MDLGLLKQLQKSNLTFNIPGKQVKYFNTESSRNSHQFMKVMCMQSEALISLID
jgi:hypothetical protein